MKDEWGLTMGKVAALSGAVLAVLLAGSGARAEEGNFFTNMLKYGGTTVPPSQPANTEPPYCPTVAVPEGGAAVRSYAGAAGEGGSLRSQTTLGRVARECTRLQDGTLSVKVGVEGQVLLGPKGAPGRFEAAMTIAIKFQDKAVVSRVRRVPVTIAAGEAQGLFSVIEDNLIVPAAMAGDYDIEVRLGGAPQKAPARKRKAPVAAVAPDASAGEPAPAQ